MVEICFEENDRNTLCYCSTGHSSFFVKNDYEKFNDM